MGGIGKIVLRTKFLPQLEETKYFTEQEKQLIRDFGDQYTQIKNRCSTVDQRMLILHSAPVLMGKFLYISAKSQKDKFWNKIFKRKNQIIRNMSQYSKTLNQDILDLPGRDKVKITQILLNTTGY